MTSKEQHPTFEAWNEAVGLVHRWLERSERLDELMERALPGATGVERSRLQNLVYGVMRHHLRLESKIASRMTHAPRHRVLGILYVAGVELIEAVNGNEGEGQVAKVVHHAVERSKSLISAPEIRLVNAVLRKLGQDLQAEAPPPALAPSAKLADYFSHPEWLVRRWLAQFGASATRALLEWNQQPATVYARWRAREGNPPEWLLPTKWESFYSIAPGHWREVEALIASGQLYVQDPSTRLAVDLLALKSGESVLDLCAAPGGKSVLMADRMGEGQIVAVDLPGQRQDRLRQNLSRITGVHAFIVQADVGRSLAACLKHDRLPLEYSAVLLDVPCSNTGVMRHRVDVKERLREDDFLKHPRQQLELLLAGARQVASGGRLVYSTCSLDPDENEGVIQAFLKKRGTEFALESRILSVPWESGHDGSAAFLLRRTS